jgi:hypothetical protein
VSAQEDPEKREDCIMGLLDVGEERVKAGGCESERNITSHFKDQESAHEGHEP